MGAVLKEKSEKKKKVEDYTLDEKKYIVDTMCLKIINEVKNFNNRVLEGKNPITLNKIIMNWYSQNDIENKRNNQNKRDLDKILTRFDTDIRNKLEIALKTTGNQEFKIKLKSALLSIDNDKHLFKSLSNKL